MANSALGDAISVQLAELERSLALQLGEHASVRRSVVSNGQILGVDITPVNPSSLPVTWLETDNELQLQAGHNGGLWELDRDDEACRFIGDVVRSVIAGRVTEVFAPGRSKVTVTLPDGSERSETGYEGAGLLLGPLLGWTRWGRRVDYQPYRT